MRLCLPIQGARVRSLVWEIRSHMLCSAASKTKWDAAAGIGDEGRGWLGWRVCIYATLVDVNFVLYEQVWKWVSLPQGRKYQTLWKGGQRMEHQNLGEQLRQGGQGHLDLAREMGGNASRGGIEAKAFQERRCVQQCHETPDSDSSLPLQGVGWSPGQGTKIPQAVQQSMDLSVK